MNPYKTIELKIDLENPAVYQAFNLVQHDSELCVLALNFTFHRRVYSPESKIFLHFHTPTQILSWEVLDIIENRATWLVPSLIFSQVGDILLDIEIKDSTNQRINNTTEILFSILPDPFINTIEATNRIEIN